MRTVAASPDMIPALIERMGPAEQAEMEAIGGAAALDAMIARSTLTWCGVDEAGPVTMGGIYPLREPGVCYAWQVITPAVQDHKRAYIAQRREMMRRGLAIYQTARTFVRADYTAAIKRLRTDRWTVGEPEQINGTMACRCEVTR